MNFKHTLLASASALVLLGAASGGAQAQQIQQNLKNLTPASITPVSPSTPPSGRETLKQNVSGGSAGDSGSLRTNILDGSFSNTVEGISHDQQNNGNNNAIGVATNVVLNASAPDNVDDDGPGDVSQRLWVRGTVTDTDNSDVPVPAGAPNSHRTNLISDAYINVKGIFDVQQNNGDSNVMGVGDVVSANLGSILGQSGEHHDDSTQTVRVQGDVADNRTTVDTDRNGTSNFGERTNNITGNAFANFLGLASVQQNNGNANVIQAGTAVVADIGTDTNTNANSETMRLNVQADGTVSNNRADASGTIANTQPDRSNRIGDAFNGADGMAGIVNVQQNNGDNNAMNIANGVRVAVFSAEAVDDVVQNNVAAIGSVTQPTSGGSDDAIDTDQVRTNTLEANAFEGATGMVTVQQNNGDNNAINAANAVGASLEITGDNAELDQDVASRADGTVRNNRASQSDTSGNTITERQNSITASSFNAAKGIMAAQQNNGSNNTMNSSVGVIAIYAEDPGVTGLATAQAQAIGSVRDNTATASTDVGRSNTLNGSSFNDAQAVATVQQNNGDNNSIGASKAIAAAIDSNSFTSDEATSATALVSTTVRDNSSTSGGNDNATASSSRNTLASAFVNFSGIASVQQNNGNNNAMNDAMAVIAISDSATVTDGDGGTTVPSQIVASIRDNSATARDDTNRVNSLGASAFNGSEGVATVQQNNGDNNGISAGTAVVAALHDGHTNGSLVKASSLTDATIQGNSATIGGSGLSFSNTVDGAAFNNAQGIATVQQNNGNNNAMSAAKSVVASISPTGPLVGFNGAVMSDNKLTASVSGNTVTVANGSSFTNTLSGSFVGYRGIKTVQQNNGSNNSMQSSVSVVANLGNTPH